MIIGGFIVYLKKRRALADETWSDKVSPLRQKKELGNWLKNHSPLSKTITIEHMRSQAGALLNALSRCVFSYCRRSAQIDGLCPSVMNGKIRKNSMFAMSGGGRTKGDGCGAEIKSGKISRRIRDC